MNLKALITALVIGSSSVALAAPTAPTVRDHRTERAPARPAPAPAPLNLNHRPTVFADHGVRPVQVQPSWLTLADNLRLNGRTTIRVAKSTRAVTKLELRAQRGRTQIDKLTIYFANGGKQVVSLEGTLIGNKPIAIDLKGNARSITKIVMSGKSTRRASIDVLAL